MYYLDTLPDPQRTIGRIPQQPAIWVLNQKELPHRIVVEVLENVAEVVDAIKTMTVRGAPLIAAAGSYGVWLAAIEAADYSKPAEWFEMQLQQIYASRPTAVNLANALKRFEVLKDEKDPQQRIERSLALAEEIIAADITICEQIGVYGLELLKTIFQSAPHKPVQILTHCNAGRLGCVAWGTITAPIYKAAAINLPVHVWVSETRPRNQGASLTVWELKQAQIPHTLIVDNAAGYLMQLQKVDICIVGADRVMRNGDTINKIGTYLKALACKALGIPFYVALPSTTLDTSFHSVYDIEIELRSNTEVLYMNGKDPQGNLQQISITDPETPVFNPGFDITPAELITGFITEKGICKPDSLVSLLLS